MDLVTIAALITLIMSWVTYTRPVRETPNRVVRLLISIVSQVTVTKSHELLGITRRHFHRWSENPYWSQDVLMLYLAWYASVVDDFSSLACFSYQDYLGMLLAILDPADAIYSDT